MNQQNNQLNIILSNIKQKSRKYIQVQQYSKTQISITNHTEYQNNDEQYLIRRSDLKTIIQKLTHKLEQRLYLLQEKEKQNKQCFKLLNKNELLLQQYKLKFQNKEKIYKKNIQELEYLYNKQKKQKELLMIQYNWANNKNIEQLKQLERLKKLTRQGNQLTYRIVNKKKQQNVDNKAVSTPNRQDGLSLDKYVVKYSQSVASHVQSDINNLNSQKKWEQKLKKSINQAEKDHLIGFDQTVNIIDKDEITSRDRLIKMLGQKCIALQSQIEKIMKKYLGQINITSNSNSNKNSNSRQYMTSEPESISPFSHYSSKQGLALKDNSKQLLNKRDSFKQGLLIKQSSQQALLIKENMKQGLRRKTSQVQLSGAFKIQEQQNF